MVLPKKRSIVPPPKPMIPPPQPKELMTEKRSAFPPRKFNSTTELKTGSSGTGSKFFGKFRSAPTNVGGSNKINAPKNPEDKKGWWRRNWCCGVRIFLAFIGIFIPFYILLLHPCDEQVEKTVHLENETQIIYEKQPVDLFLVIDSSGSVLMTDGAWEKECEAAATWARAFNDTLPTLKVGVGQFQDEAAVEYPLQSDVTKVIEGIEVPLEASFDLGGGTGFTEPLELAEEQLQNFGTENSFQVAVIISDGEPFDREEDFYEAASRMKANNITIVGIMINGNARAQEILQTIASCEDYPTNCPYFAEIEQFDELKRLSETMAASVVSFAGETETELISQNMVVDEQTTCEPGLFWLFLLLLLPLLLLLCAGTKKIRKRKVRKALPKDIEAPAPPAFIPPTEDEKVPEPGTKKGKRYKWDIKATDHYLWNFSGGAKPMNVNYGNKAPPSAPKDLRLGRVKRACEEWEEADGYVYTEEEQTLEEWVEEWVEDNKDSWIFKFCCCCCCCNKVTSQEKKEQEKKSC